MGSSTVLPASAESVITQLGTDIDGEAADDYSGFSVSLSGDGTRVAIGAWGNDGNGVNSGHTRIYEYDSINGWTQLGADINGEAAGDRSGYSVSLSGDGTRVAIGAWGNDGNGVNSGHTRIYEYDSINGWTQLGADIDGEAAGDLSGYSVALSSDGTRVAIGATDNDDGGDFSGHTRIYEYDSINGWTQLGADINGEAASDYSGFSVSLSADGTRVAIGAPDNDDGGNNSGHTRIYEYDGINGDADGIDGWTQLGTDIDGEAASDRSGFSVSLSADGTRVAIGARENDGGGNGSGHTRIYEYDGIDGDADGIDGWTQLGADIDGEAASDYSGFSVSLSGDGTRVAIGAIYNDDGGDNFGHTRIYKYRDSNGWTQVGTDIDGEAAGDQSGRSVSLSGDGTRVAIGAIYNDDGGTNSGHTRIFRISAVSQDSQRESSENPGPPGIFLTLTTHTPQHSHGYTVTFGAYAIAPNSPYVVTIRNEQTGTQRVLTSGTVSPGGHLEKSTQLPQLEAGSHTITVSARSNTGAFLTLGNRIVVDGQGNIHSVSPEQLQPSIR